MSDVHVFVASGDSCPLCLALAGSVVSDGYRPHPGCTCNTVRMDDGERVCEFEYEEEDIWLAGGRNPQFRVRMSITVTCPDGSTQTIPGWAEVGLESLRGGDSDDFLEDIAHDACDELCDAHESEHEFLCC